MARRLRKREPEPEKPVRRAKSLDDLEPGPVEKPASATITRATFTMRAAEIRRQAAQDFITDPESRSVTFLWERVDRPYRKIVKLETLKCWAVDDNWLTRREQFWQEIEHKVLQHTAHRVFVQRIEELKRLTPASDALMEYLLPKTDSQGVILRYPMLTDEGKPHPYAGLPQLPLEIPPLDKFVVAFDKLHKLLMTKRGEVTSRSEQIPQRDGDSSALDPVGNAIPFSPEDIRQLSKHMLTLRQPELQSGVLEALEAIDSELASEDREALEDDEEEALDG